MELILISDSKLKIMLSPDDMNFYDIDCGSVDYGSTETRRAFWSILDTAKKKAGFDAASDRVYIQMYPSRDGGCEMYVTKLGQKAQKSSCPSAEKKGAQILQLAYVFPSIRALLSVCNTLTKRTVRCESSAYAGEAGECMLFLSCEQSAKKRNCLGFIEEYGAQTDHGISLTFAAEHYRCICPYEAVETLSSLA